MTFSAFYRPAVWGHAPDDRYVNHAPKREVAVPAVKGIAFEASPRRFGENFDCSTHAAVIKMMMATFGPDLEDVFEQVTGTAGGYAVTMKDEFKVEVSHDELKQAAMASRFTGGDSVAVSNANFMFAVFVKRKQLKGHHQSFQAALAETLQGETTQRCLQGMGVHGMSQYVSAQQLASEGGAGVLETQTRGSAFVLNGVQHQYGEERRVDRGYGYRLMSPGERAGKRLPPRNSAVISKVAVGVKPQNIWSGFYQGAQGNCVTVSAIKAAMMRFGQNPAGIYRQISALPGGYEVVMRDGRKVSLSHEELRKAERGSNLKGTDQALLADANFLYAVSAKRAQLDNNDFIAGRSFEWAMYTLNDGEMPGQALRRLGLSGYVWGSDSGELAKGAIGTLAGGGHSVVAIDGAVDDYGAKRGLVSSGWLNRGYVALKLV